MDKARSPVRSSRLWSIMRRSAAFSSLKKEWNMLKFPCLCMFLLFAKNSKLNPKVFGQAILEAIYVQTSPTQGNGPRGVLLRLRSMLRIPATSRWIRSQQAETRREQKSWEKMGKAPIRMGKETRCPGAPWPHVWSSDDGVLERPVRKLGLLPNPYCSDRSVRWPQWGETKRQWKIVTSSS